jgi:hypothetical protein
VRQLQQQQQQQQQQRSRVSTLLRPWQHCKQQKDPYRCQHQQQQQQLEEAPGMVTQLQAMA